MTSLLDQHELLAPIVASGRSRAIAAGVDANEYDIITAGLDRASQWPSAFRAAGAAHHERAQRDEADGRRISAADAYMAAASCCHIATTVPSADLAGHKEAGEAMTRGLALLEPDVFELKGTTFTGTLVPQVGDPRAPLVVIVPGLDSSRAEFHANAVELRRRGLATLALDGPGQGTLAPSSVVRADYDVVVREALDAALKSSLAPTAIGIMALSLGGFYGALTLAREPRLAAGVTVSGPSRMSYARLPGLLQEILTIRAGSQRAAAAFADQVDVGGFAHDIAQPLLVVDGEKDVISGFDNGQLLADLAPHGEHLLVAGGDHLVGNRRWAWLPFAADFLADRLT